MELPDLIITDIEMPHLDGVQMIARLRDQSRFSDLPIRVVSGNGSGTTDEALKAGADEAMHKRVDFSSLIGCVNQLLVK